jgi:PncC family amidohydrolase
MISDSLYKAANVVIQLAKKKSLKISGAESCTGGLISSALTSIPGSSAVFDLGLITYANNAKSKLLGIPSDLLIKYGAVSEETAEAMLMGMRNIYDSDIYFSVTGIAGPSGGTSEKPIGTVFAGLFYNKNITIFKKNFNGDRYSIQEQSALLVFTEIKNILDD